MVLDTNKFRLIFPKPNLVEKGEDEYIDRSMGSKGITVLYRNSQYKKKVSTIVNPCLLLKGKEDDPHKLISKLGKRIFEYFNGKYNLENFTLTGLTLMSDINVGSKDKVSDYIKILQRIGKVKCFSPSQYECFDDSNSFCLDGNCNGISFLIYDLHAALAGHWNDNRLKYTEGILRTEVRLTTINAIREYVSKDSSIASQILELSTRKQEIFMDVFTRIIPSGDFRKKNVADIIVKREIKDLRLQRRMLHLIELIPEKRSLLLALKALKYRWPNRIMDAFGKINLSPVTISKRMDINFLPSLYSYIH